MIYSPLPKIQDSVSHREGATSREQPSAVSLVDLVTLLYEATSSCLYRGLPEDQLIPEDVLIELHVIYSQRLRPQHPTLGRLPISDPEFLDWRPMRAGDRVRHDSTNSPSPSTE